ncbi:hypothetical protein QUB05_26265 [Microcoleus sp. F10-C6]|uniref:hypothetical protein n=1 Tax=unclassified Microcoleus TaxID=2642155 RepID=UPI002FD5666C
MFHEKFAISEATYSSDQKRGWIEWLTENDTWTDKFNDAAFFDEETAKVKLEETLNLNQRPGFGICLSMVKVCWHEPDNN